MVMMVFGVDLLDVGTRSEEGGYGRLCWGNNIVGVAGRLGAECFGGKKGGGRRKGGWVDLLTLKRFIKKTWVILGLGL